MDTGYGEPIEGARARRRADRGVAVGRRKWVVDTWIARRDIGGPPSRAAWEGHLGLRPWNVFSLRFCSFRRSLPTFWTVWREGVREQFAATTVPGENRYGNPSHPTSAGTAEEVRRFFPDWEQLGELIVQPAGDVADNAFVELPPAGVIPLADWEDPECRFRELFGADLSIEVEHVRADCALRALEDAQHLDRIRLDDRGNDVRLLVPPADSAVDGWMVFARGCCQADCVDVYVRKEDQFDPANGPDPSDKVTTLRYPRNAWSSPRSDEAMGSIRHKVRNGSVTRIVGYANTEDRRSLAFVRSQLIFFDLSDSFNPAAHPVLSSGIFTLPHKNEAILILIGDRAPVVGDSPAGPPA